MNKMEIAEMQERLDECGIAVDLYEEQMSFEVKSWFVIDVEPVEDLEDCEDFELWHTVGLLSDGDGGFLMAVYGADSGGGKITLYSNARFLELQALDMAYFFIELSRLQGKCDLHNEEYL